MATPRFSPKLEEKNDEDIRPISAALVDDSSLLNNEEMDPADMNVYNDDTMNLHSSEGNNVVIKHSPTKYEGNLRSTNKPDKDAVSSEDDLRNTLSDDGENIRNDSVVKSEDEASKNMTEETDGGIISKIIFWDCPDEEVIKSHKVQLYNLNQQPGNEGGFLKMALDGETGLKVTTTGTQQDPYTFWLTHYTLDQQRRQVVVFENERCSKVKNKKCILYTKRVAGSDNYVLAGKTIDEIPERLGDIDPYTGFLKRPKAIGSELLFLKSMLTSKESPLLVGFDGAGQPIPLNKVRKYSSDFQAFFRILEAG